MPVRVLRKCYAKLAHLEKSETNWTEIEQKFTSNHELISSPSEEEADSDRIELDEQRGESESNIDENEFQKYLRMGREFDREQPTGKPVVVESRVQRKMPTLQQHKDKESSGEESRSDSSEHISQLTQSRSFEPSKSSPSYSPLESPERTSSNSNTKEAHESSVDQSFSFYPNLSELLNELENEHAMNNHIESNLFTHLEQPALNDKNRKQLTQRGKDENRVEEINDSIASLSFSQISLNNCELNFDYLDIFGDCIEVICDILDLIELGEFLVDWVSISHSKCSTNEPQKRADSNKNELISDSSNLTSQLTQTVKESKLDEFDEFVKRKALSHTANLSKKLKKPNEKPCPITLDQSHSNLRPKLSFEDDRFETSLMRKIELLYVEKIHNCFLNLKLASAGYLLEKLDLNSAKLLLEQHIILNKSSSKCPKYTSKLRELLMLNFYFMGLDLLFNCGWTLFFTFCEGFLNTYSDLLEGQINEASKSIEKLIQQETLNLCNEREKSIHINSPKIRNLCHFIRDIRSNLLVILERDTLVLLEKLKKEISEQTGIQTGLYIFSDNYHNDDRSFEHYVNKNDCLVVNFSRVLNGYLQYFTCVIGFELLKDENFIENVIKRQLIFAQFELYQVDLIKHLNILKPKSIEEEKIERVAENRRIILSNCILEDKFMVELLESKGNFLIYERNYEQISSSYRLKSSLDDVHILLNEFTGVIFFDLNQTSPNEFSRFLRQLSLLKFKLRYVFLVLSEQPNEDHWESVVMYAQLSKFCFKLNQPPNEKFKIQLVNLSQKENFKYLIESLLSNESKFDKKTSKSSIEEQRYYDLNINPSKEEIFLLSLACFNSFSAQYLLATMQLDELIQMDKFRFANKLNLLDQQLDIYKILSTILTKSFKNLS